MQKIYDVIIIGAGPAGLTAGLYAKRAELDVLIIEKQPMSGGQIINTYEIENYPGIPSISGFELANRFREHCNHLEVPFKEQTVEAVELEGNIKKIHLSNQETLEARATIIATGADYRKLGVLGEVELTGRGVSYCATCDGAFFREKEVMVVGGGDVAVEDAIFLSRLCKKVYVVHRRDEFRAAKRLSTKLSSLENVEIIWNSIVEKINGEDLVTGADVKSLETNEIRNIPVNGVFVAVGTIPDTAMYQDVITVDENGYIVAGEDCKTNVAGVFVAGDVRQKQLKQVITAAADGANAITAVERYLLEE